MSGINWASARAYAVILIIIFFTFYSAEVSDAEQHIEDGKIYFL